MKVIELIKALEEMPQDAEVTLGLSDDDGECYVYLAPGEVEWDNSCEQVVINDCLVEKK